MRKGRRLGQCSGMTPDARGHCRFAVVDFGDMKIGEKIKRLFQRQASAETQEERAARAKAERERDQVLEEAAIKSQVDAGLSGPQIPRSESPRVGSLGGLRVEAQRGRLGQCSGITPERW